MNIVELAQDLLEHQEGVGRPILGDQATSLIRCLDHQLEDLAAGRTHLGNAQRHHGEIAVNVADAAGYVLACRKALVSAARLDWGFPPAELEY